MSTAFVTVFGSGDLIEPDHVKQFAQPVNDLESGATLFRAATNDSGNYQVDFQASANPDGHSIESLVAGQMILFKASHNSPAAAQLKVLVEGGSGSETHPLFFGGSQIGAGEIRQDQIVAVVFNNTTTPQFDVVGIRGAGSLNELGDSSISSPATGEVLRYDGTNFVNEVLEMGDVNGLPAAIASAGGSTTGHLSELQALSLSEGDMLIANSSGELTKLAPGSEGYVLTITSGVPAWGESVGGGGDWLTRELVAFGTRYVDITSTSQDLRSSAFTPVSGRQYLIRWIANHSASVDQLDLAAGISNSQPHFCRAEETGSSTNHDIGFASGNAYDYPITESHRTRTHEFVWTATTSNEVEIVLGQPSLDYGEFTGTMLVYEVRDEATNLGWGAFGTGYRWLQDPSTTSAILSGGAYKSGVSLDSSKTYAFVGRWCKGYAIKLILKQGTDYWHLPPDSDTWATASASDNSRADGIYFESSNSSQRGEFIRLFSPPSTGTFELGCCLYAIEKGCFWLIELPS